MRDDRNRQLEALADLDLLPDDQVDGAAGMLLVTTTCSSYPTAAGSVYCCNPVWIDADDTEGATPTFSAAADTIYALNVGSEVPPAGSNVIAVAVGGRVVFAWNTPPP
jgi:hypothetical protein